MEEDPTDTAGVVVAVVVGQIKNGDLLYDDDEKTDDELEDDS